MKNVITYYKIKSERNLNYPLKILIIIILGIFIAHFTAMYIESIIYHEHQFLPESVLISTVLLVIIIYPMLYSRIYLPLKKDIIALRTAKEVVAESETKFRTLFENAPDPYYIVDYKFNFVDLNKATEEVSGYFKEELLSKNILSQKLLNKQEVLKLTEIYADSNINPIEPYEILMITKDKKEVYLEVKHLPITINGQELILCMARDTTIRKKTEQELIKAKKNAEESDNLKSQFLTKISHEIRTPLNAIVGNAEIIKNEFSNNLNLKENVEGITVGSQRITRTINILIYMSMIFSNTYPLKLENIDVYTSVIVPLFNKYLPDAKDKGLNFSLIKKTQNTRIEADQLSTNEIFDNIINNAIKFTEVGEVKISVNQNESNELIVEVSDSGIGITKDYLHKIFRPFSQEDQSYSRQFEGIGLGLTLTKVFCELNNFKLNIQSRVGYGTTTQVILAT